MSPAQLAGRPLTRPDPLIVPPRLHRSAVPEHEPRSASRVGAWTERRSPAHIQQTLALRLPEESAPEARDDAPFAALEQEGVLPEPKGWGAGFIQAAMEVASGLRSASQLVRWTTPEVHAILVRRAP